MSGTSFESSWTATFISNGGVDGNLPVFRQRFTVASEGAAAELRASFHGIGVIRINGVVVSDSVLEPGWQSYRHRLTYSTTDVAQLLRAGENIIEAEVGPGWYSGRIGFFGQREVYGKSPAVIAELRIEEPEGQVHIVATDSSWFWRPGPTLSAELYDGERYDARLAAALAADSSGWLPVTVVEENLARLEPPTAPPVRRTETLRPQQVITTPSGATIIDFGRNIVGWTRIRTRGAAGTQVVLKHAEVLEDGELGVRPLRSAAATDSYVFSGQGVEQWEPSFTYHGFRYVQVEGWPNEHSLADGIEAVFVHTDLTRTGWFRTSHPGLAQLHENVVASTRGNFVSLPTDCPQRDERLGWTGDIAIFAATAMFLYDASGFLRGWLRDVAAEQRDDGRIPIFVPEVPFPERAKAIDQFQDVRAAVWGDAATLVPDAVYEATGDAAFFEENYELMRRWVDGVASAVDDDLIWRNGFQFGDWLDPIAPSDDPAAGATAPDLIATAYFAHSCRVLSKAAAVTGRSEDRLRYQRFGDEIAAAFRRNYITTSGLMTSDSQTAYAIALTLDLLDDDDQRRVASERLVQLVRAAGHRIGTGFVGTALILDALAAADAFDDAYALLLQTEVPSWLYAVEMGATTIWERWDSMLPDGSINPGEMTSFNHYALGSVAQWLHSTVAGIAPAEPGYSRIRIAPRPRGPIVDAGATHHTPFGTASVDWAVKDGEINVSVVVPDGTVASIELEGQTPVERGPGTHELRAPLRAHMDSAEEAASNPARRSLR
ncbi:alpha-L-rhamnosidase [Desertivibrio insolitus]|uniref:alpha-L-rhamnosidase n=1 Tax=Herbiconiux sp. SYSU D00978 TaxID=2812562 RepID=UPI001A975674|nr:alpha-L-rhamnosidase [Herbiconiux sp. SYSU D00978]